MKFAVVSDEPYPVNEAVVSMLQEHGHSVVRYGSLATQAEVPYADAALEAAQAVARGDCDEGVFFCWTGTGISIAANKVPGVRAALCSDAETARGARIWNHANVLALSNRALSTDLAKEVVMAWLETPGADPRGAESVRTISEFENRPPTS